MSSPIKNVLVVGRGPVATSILHALTHTTPPVAPSILTRPAQEANPLPHNANLKHHTTDFSPASLKTAFESQDAVISTISGGDYEMQTRLIDAAVAAGVKLFIPNEFGQDSLNEAVRERLPPARAKGRVIAYLKRKSEEKKGFSWTALAVGTIFDDALRSGDLGFDLEWRSATVYGAGSQRFAATTMSALGNAVASIVRHASETRNRYLYTSSFITTPNDVVKSLERVMGKEWTVISGNVEECEREGQLRLEKGFLDGAIVLMGREVMFDEGLGAIEKWEERGREDARALGMEEEELDEVVSHVVEEFERVGKADCGCG